MFELDKQKFGAFEAQLRKEKGLTQKDVAQQLYISDKAVSKWETGNTFPDAALLVPLSELLGVTVTELLLCERMDTQTSMEQDRVEDIVKTAISYSDASSERAYRANGLWGIFYALALLISCIEVLASYKYGHDLLYMGIAIPFAAIIGAYFCFFAKLRLPRYYDENKISVYTDGPFEMSCYGMHFNNNNWPHILTAGRIWSIALMVAFPAVCFLTESFFSTLPFGVFLPLTLFAILGGLFIPTYIVGKKYA